MKHWAWLALALLLAGCGAAATPTARLAVAPTAAATAMVAPTAAPAIPPTWTPLPPTASGPTKTAIPPREDSTATPIPPTVTAVPPAATSAPPTAPPAPAAPPFASGGLGLSRAEWEKRHGPGKDGPFIRYENDRYLVYFYPDKQTGNINSLSVEYNTKTIPLGQARDETRLLMPADATLRRTYTSGERLIDVYNSASLIGRFPQSGERGSLDDLWDGEDPGTFIAINKISTVPATRGQIFTVIIAIGNNP